MEQSVIVGLHDTFFFFFNSKNSANSHFMENYIEKGKIKKTTRGFHLNIERVYNQA